MKTGWVSYTGLLVAASALSFVKMIVYAKLMAPDLFGIVSMLLGTYAVFVIFASAGMVDGSLKLASMTKEANQLAPMMGTALTAGLVTTSVITFFAIWPLVWAYDALSMGMIAGLYFLVLSAFVFNISEVHLRAGKRFNAFAQAVFLKSLLSILLGLACTYFGQPQAVVVTEALAFLIVFSWFQSSFGTSFGFRRPERARFTELAKAGIPISISSVSKKLSFMGDRWLILFLFGPELLGQYSFLMLFYLLGISVVGLVNTAFGPILLCRMSDEPIKGVIDHTIHLIIRSVVPATALACVALLLGFEPVLNSFFPQYAGEHMDLCAVIIVAGMGLMAAQALLEWLLIGQDLSFRLIQANMTAIVVMIAAFAVAASAPESLVMLCAIFTLTRGTSFALVAWFIFCSRGYASSIEKDGS